MYLTFGNKGYGTNARKKIAERLRSAETNAKPIDPFGHEIGEKEVVRAYNIQHLNTRHALSNGRIFRGRKIGLTAKVMQRQLGVDEPDYGALFADMEIENGGSLHLSNMISPRIEAEIALVIGQDIDQEHLDLNQLKSSVAYAMSSLEIVDSRLKNWRIGFVDTIADNGASSKFVLGEKHVSLGDIDLKSSKMELFKNGKVVSAGKGSATLGDPLNALAWLANILVQHGHPLRKGDIVLTGALGPVSSIASNDVFTATFDGLSDVTLNIK